ncbi:MULTISPECIES: hypothetical protein [unclassified Acidovorax]|uniref:hypothetical protein n=2 Tax=unclassified Acidovorax TaxID=2684926 RepID=UPI0028830FEF|nr:MULTISPECIES: hypothetical protein [unclassified Acidovorax]
MSSMAQNLVVGLIVALAALYVLWRYMPQRWRGRLGRVHSSLGQAPGCGSSSDGGGCATCGSCGSAGAAAGDQGAKAPVEKPVAMPPSHRHGAGD